MRPGFGLPRLLVATLAVAILALVVAVRTQDTRERAMIAAAEAELLTLMTAIDKYQSLYSALPKRLSDLNRVGYRESSGVLICTFTYHYGQNHRADYIELESKHRSARTSVVARHPNGIHSATRARNERCTSARRPL